MRRVLLANDSTLRVVRIPGEHGVFSFLDDMSQFQVRRYLEEYADDHMAMTQMRMALAEDTFGMPVSNLDDAEVLDEVAHRVAMGHLWIAEELEEPQPAIREPESASSSSAQPPPELPRTKKLTWIEFQVVWDASGKPVKNVRLVVRTPDGVENYHDTNGEGKVRIEELEPGSCDVRCDLKGAKLADTLHFVGMGSGGGSSNGDNGAAQSSTATLRIAQIDAHKVKKGESIKSLASAVGMTWQELSKFNWDTDVPTEINKHLRDDVGCTKKTKDGYNYMFDDSDDPGIMYIPRKWSQTGLATGGTHVIRVRKIISGPMLRFVLESSTTGHLLPFHPFRIFDLSDKQIATGQTNDCAIGSAQVPSDGEYYVLPGDGKTYKVQGKVHYGSSTSPLADAAVDVTPWDCQKMSVTTGPEGELEITDVPEGELVIAYQGKEYHVVVSSDISDGFFFVPGVGGKTPEGKEVTNDADIAAAPPSTSAANSASSPPEYKPINPEDF